MSEVVGEQPAAEASPGPSQSQDQGQGQGHSQDQGEGHCESPGPSAEAVDAVTAVSEIDDIELASNLLGLAQGEFIILQMPTEEKIPETLPLQISRITGTSVAVEDDPDYVPGRGGPILKRRRKKSNAAQEDEDPDFKKMKLFTYHESAAQDGIIEVQLVEVQPDKSEDLAEIELAARNYENQTTAVAMRPGLGGSKLLCSYCGKTFPSKSTLTAHISVHKDAHKFPCPNIGCDKLFRTKEMARRHYAAHSGEKPFECEYCQKKFVSNHGLREHVSIHLDTKMYKCSQCDKDFRQLSSLSRHVSGVHSTGKRYACEICSKTFTQAVYLRSHMKSHTGERPYRCDICNKLYAHRSDLNRHKIIHSGTRPYSCDWCGTTFADSSSRRRHMRDHNEMRGTYNCHLCSQYFRRFGLLKTHLNRRHNIIEVVDGDDKTLKIVGTDTVDMHDGDLSSPKAKSIQGQLLRVLLQLRKAKPNTQYQFILPQKSTAQLQDQVLNITRNFRDSASGVTVEEQDLAVQLAMNALQAEQESVLVSGQDLALNQDGSISEHVYLTELPPSGSTVQIVNEKGDIEYVNVEFQVEGAPKTTADSPDNNAENADNEQVNDENEQAISQNQASPTPQSSTTGLPTKSLEIVGENGETEVVDVVEIDENVFQMHYDQQPEFENVEYLRWLETFVELCRCWEMPLQVELYEKVTHVHKVLLDALATPKGRLADKRYYECLSNHCGVLGTLITQHLAAVLTNMR